MQYLGFLLSSLVGFLVSSLISHPNSKFNRHLPHVKIKFFQISPRLKIVLRKRVINLHHWMNFSIILVITITVGWGLLDNLFSKGFLVGGIIQGFTFPDWKQIVHKKD